jgi:hypothetical protein
MATTMVTTYQHIEAQGRATHRAGLAWGGGVGVGPLPCKWGEEREEEPLPRRIIKSGISMLMKCRLLPKAYILLNRKRLEIDSPVSTVQKTHDYISRLSWIVA